MELQFSLDVTRPRPDLIRFELRGELDHLSSPRLVAAVAERCGDGAAIVIDLRNLTFVDGGGLTSLARVGAVCDGASIGVCLAAPPPFLQRLIRVVDLPLPPIDHTG